MPWLSSPGPWLRAQAVGFRSRVIEVGRGHIDGDRCLATGFETATEHRLHNDSERLFVGVKPRSVTPLVADESRLEASLPKDVADGAIERDGHLQGFAITRRTDRNDQDVLNIEVAASVQTA